MRCLVSFIAAVLGLAAILPAQTEPEVRSLEVNGRLIRYQVRGGFAVVEGDIIIGTAATGKSSEPQASVLTFTSAQKWPSATMAYDIDPAIPNPQRILDGIEAALGKRFEFLGIHAQLEHVLLGRARPAIAEAQIVLGRAAPVAVTFEQQTVRGILLQVIDRRLELGPFALLDGRLVAEMARLWGIGCMPHCWGSALSQAACVHLVSLMPDASYSRHTESAQCWA